MFGRFHQWNGRRLTHSKSRSLRSYLGERNNRETRYSKPDRHTRRLSFVNDSADHVDALIKELLALDRTESVPTLHPSSTAEVEQQQAKRKKVRQALVLALSLRSIAKGNPRR